MEKVKYIKEMGRCALGQQREGVVDMGNYGAEERDRRSSLLSYADGFISTENRTHTDFRDIIQQQQT